MHKRDSLQLLSEHDITIVASTQLPRESKLLTQKASVSDEDICEVIDVYLTRALMMDWLPPLGNSNVLPSLDDEAKTSDNTAATSKMGCQCIKQVEQTPAKTNCHEQSIRKETCLYHSAHMKAISALIVPDAGSPAG